jgi:hypothetical protein
MLKERRRLRRRGGPKKVGGRPERRRMRRPGGRRPWWWLDGPMRTKAPKMSGLGGSNPLRVVQGLFLFLLVVMYLLLNVLL